MSQCTLCPAGYSSWYSYTACNPCNPGTAAPAPGSQCTPCPINTYAAGWGSAVCTMVPFGKPSTAAPVYKNSKTPTHPLTPAPTHSHVQSAKLLTHSSHSYPFHHSLKHSLLGAPTPSSPLPRRLLDSANWCHRLLREVQLPQRGLSRFACIFAGARLKRRANRQRARSYVLLFSDQ